MVTCEDFDKFVKEHFYLCANKTDLQESTMELANYLGCERIMLYARFVTPQLPGNRKIQVMLFSPSKYLSDGDEDDRYICRYVEY